MDVRFEMKLREGGGVARPRRTADERRAGREWARRSADRAVLKLSEELARVRAHLTVVEDALAEVAGCDEVGQRLRALLPALRKKLAGRAPTWLETLRRNVALHADAEGVDLETAGEAALKRAQKGPRLEARLAAERGSAGEGTRLSPDAAPFVPASFLAPAEEDSALDGVADDVTNSHVVEAAMTGMGEEQHLEELQEKAIEKKLDGGQQDVGLVDVPRAADQVGVAVRSAAWWSARDRIARAWLSEGPVRVRTDGDEVRAAVAGVWIPAGLPPDPGEGFLFGPP